MDYLLSAIQKGIFSAVWGNYQQRGYWINQSPRELEQLCKWIEREGSISSYLEIGLGAGGTWTFLSETFAFEKTVGVTLILHPYTTVQHPHNGQLLVADSQSEEAAQFIRANAPYDLVFIDGLHTYDGVMADYQLCRPYARYMVFHDISGNWGTEQLGAKRAWEEIREQELLLAEWIDPERPIGIGLVEVRCG